MLERIRSKIAARVRRLLPARAARRFARQQDGAAAVEFALVALPFLALTFAILETALVFFAGQTLEAAATDAGRLIMTGQAQTAGLQPGRLQDPGVQSPRRRIVRLLERRLCRRQDLYQLRRRQHRFADHQRPVRHHARWPITPAAPGNIVVVSLYYQWPIYVSLLGNNLSNLNGGNRLLVATSVFRNEPY